jgi:two-component sensor histidine kinase
MGLSSMIGSCSSTLEEVIVTGDLATRRRVEVDPSRLKQALLDIGSRMAEDPTGVLQRFVDLAMEIGGGVSSGISVLEDATPAFFRWQFLRGSLAAFEGATTPRNYSPCGMTLDADAPVLARHPERYYVWIADAGITVPEVLLVPLRRGSQLIATLWIVSDRIGHFNRGHADALMELAGFVSAALQVFRTEEQLKEALAEQEALAREMSHRVKNLFSIIEGMVLLTARRARTKEELAEALSGRIRALSRAHGLVRRSFTIGGPVGMEAELEPLLRAVLNPHEPALSVPGNLPASRVLLAGPDVRLGDHALNNIALIFHELVTNAAKYGALHDDEGSVDIAWAIMDNELLLQWAERGGKAIEGPPASAGFGTQLVTRTVRDSLGGSVSYEWKRDGLEVTLRLPMDSLAR